MSWKLNRMQFIKSLGIGVPGLIMLVNHPITSGMQLLDFNNISNSDYEPRFLALHRNGELNLRAQELWKIMAKCTLCPRLCNKNRLDGHKGTCGANSQLYISSFSPHFGEESPLVGKSGSGTIFFTNCALRCVFCINWEISMGGQGHRRSIDELAKMMIALQKMGCSNINLVTPTHYSPHILMALDSAARMGLRLPIVYNTCGYERIEILRMLDGVVDIYLPDFKYSDGEMAFKYSAKARNYPEVTQNALIEMNRQVGIAIPDADGLIRRGLMVRHLVMPNGVSGTPQVLEWIANHLPKNTYINLMAQYRPMYKASSYPEISRPITKKEYQDAIAAANKLGLTKVNIQDIY